MEPMTEENWQSLLSAAEAYHATHDDEYRDDSEQVPEMIH